MRTAVLIVVVTALAGVVLVGGVFFAVGSGIACLNEGVRGYMGVSKAFEVQSAAAQGDLVTVRAILRSEPDLVEARNEEGWTPLHEAARGGYVAVAGLLLEHGANANAGDVSGATPLHAALRAGETRMVRLLLAHGARASSLHVSTTWRDDGSLPGLAARQCKG